MNEAALVACIFAAAVLYSSVGHAGASGYLAAMAFFRIAPEDMRPAALVLNILVATIATVSFYRGGFFSWSIFWPFAVTSIPCALVGGYVRLPGNVFRPLVGCVLLLAAYRLFRNPATEAVKHAHIGVALLCGAAIGLLSGLTGTGGGIFLSPLLLLMGWAQTKQTSGISAAFVLSNSIAGIAGLLVRTPHIPSQTPYWAVAAVAGGLLGSQLGSRFQNILLRRLLAVVLVIAAGKLIFT
jgi:uncharacterized membrane protein YfcA